MISRPPSDPEQPLECLEQCLTELPPESHHLIQVYYQGEKRAKINHRQDLAQQLGISQNALRLRAHQIRLKLETCVQKCLNRLYGG